ncbi:MAG: SxtJ family membrane protein [Thermoanaerobaculales bacterium]|jgi:polyferredoxin|nr:SxtJ family membrane protein [Thermoanaerobaculales bacterium]
MSVIRVNRDPSDRQLRQFGLIWLGFLTFFGAVAWFRFEAPQAAVGLWIAAVVVPVIGWVPLPFMRLIFVGMSIIAWPIGFVVSHVVLAAVYYLVVTPIGLAMRLVGYDPMTRKGSDDEPTRWVQRSNERPPESYFRQF